MKQPVASMSAATSCLMVSLQSGSPGCSSLLSKEVKITSAAQILCNFDIWDGL